MNIQEYKLERDLLLACEQANSFPEGIPEAMAKLQDKLHNKDSIQLYGISRPEQKRGILYYSCAAIESEEEVKKYNLKPITMKAGIYYTIDVQNFHRDLTSIGKAFEKILSLEDIDPEGYCVEAYSGEDVRCMVRKKDNQN